MLRSAHGGLPGRVRFSQVFLSVRPASVPNPSHIALRCFRHCPKLCCRVQVEWCRANSKGSRNRCRSAFSGQPAPSAHDLSARMAVSTLCATLCLLQVSQPASIADNNYTDKPVPNAFWRAFSALIYLIPCMDTIQLGITTYGIVPQTLALFQIGGECSSACIMYSLWCSGCMSAD